MKHVKALSSEKPASAEYTAWVEAKNVFGKLPLTGEQALWVNAEVDHLLQK